MNTQIEHGKFNPLTPTTVLPEVAGTRIVTVTYKGSKNEAGEIVPAKRANVWMAVQDFITPELVASRMDDLMPHFQEYLNGVVDSIVRDGHKNDLVQIHTEYLDIDKVLEKLTETNRLTGEQIAAWFDANIRDVLTLTFADRYFPEVGVLTEEQSAKVNKLVNAYSEKFQSLAGGKTSPIESDMDSMSKAIHMAECGKSGIGARFLARFERIREKKNNALEAL